ncbi:MAG: LamG domain-containing protein [Candidatus Eremiobacteraeota bacterium]|nr:LamG domain-containing protein [Candidatus Eremiobacteraeota bacterium]MBV8365455.1 LamG domain-containing protein [Candidatus Eremiobacteraeota bacterium]
MHIAALIVALVTAPGTFLVFNGADSYVEIPSSPAHSLTPAGLTVAVWMRPDSLAFAKTEGSLASQQYVHWLGKGQSGQQEWTFRMYSLTQPGPRQNRISFYAFSPPGGRGCGSYFQDPIQPGRWIHVVGVIDPSVQQVSIYKNGQLRHSDSYASLAPGPQMGGAPMRIGSKDLTSYFQGAIGPIEIWNRALSATEVAALFNAGAVPQNGLAAQYYVSEGSGSTIHDAVGHHDGAIHGASWGQGAGSIATGGGQSGGGC